MGPIHHYLRQYIKKTETDEEKFEKEEEKITEMKGKKEGDKIIYENGDYYIGEEKEGIRHGKGTLYDKKGNIKYEGDFIAE